MGQEPDKAQVEEYDRTLLFMRLMFAVEQKLAKQSGDDDVARQYAVRIEDSWREGEATFAEANDRLRFSCREYLEKTRNLPPFQVALYDSACSKNDAPTLTQMQSKYWGVIEDILERGHFRDQEQYAFIKRALELSAQGLEASESELSQLRRILRDHDYPDSGVEPVVRGGIFAIPLPNGKFGAIVLTNSGVSFNLVAYDGFWDQQPDLSSVTQRGFFRHKWAVNLPPLTYKLKFPEPFPDEYIHLGSRSFSESELDELLDSRGMMICRRGTEVADALYRVWRRKFDIEGLQAEQRAVEEQIEEQERSGREGQSLKAMRRKNPFTHWRDVWPRSAAATANRIVRDGAEKLIELEESAGPASEKEAVLKRMIDDFNELYDQTGCIETGEAEEVVDWVERLAFSVGLSNDDEALTGHRTW